MYIYITKLLDYFYPFQALHFRKYSIQSDVWSYGSVVYEIWALGCKPFEDVSNLEVGQHHNTCCAITMLCT